MSTTEPDGLEPKKHPSNTEPQQQLAHELEQIAAQELRGSTALGVQEEGTKIIYESPELTDDKPEDQERFKGFEKQIDRLQQSTVNGLTGISERIALINPQPRFGEEWDPLDAQFVKYVARVREMAIDTFPDRAEIFWSETDKIKQSMYAIIEAIDVVKSNSRTVLGATLEKTHNNLGELKNIALQADVNPQHIDSKAADSDRSLVSGIETVSRNLGNLPRKFGELESLADELVTTIARLARASGRPDTEDELFRLQAEMRGVFGSYTRGLHQTTSGERDRISDIQQTMSDLYGHFRSELQKSFAILEGKES